MNLLKNHKWIAGLTLALLISLGVCIYSLAKVSGSGASADTGFGMQWRGGEGASFRSGERGAFPGSRNGSQAAGQQSATDGSSGASAASGSGNGRRSDTAGEAQSAAEGSAPGSGQGAAAGSGFARPAGMNGGGRFSGGGFGSDGQYGTALAVYAAMFAGLLAAAFYYAKAGKLRINESRRRLVVGLLLAAGLCLKLAAAPWISGYRGDIHFFTTWAQAAAKSLGTFYDTSSSDYPPLYMYILYATGKIVTLPQIAPYFLTLIKLPSIIADAVTAGLLYKAASRYLRFETAFLIAGFYMFNPAVLINATFWGQVDSFFTMIVIASVLAMTRQKLGWAAFFLTLSILMKPQGIIYTPVLLFALLRTGKPWPWLKAAAIAAVTTIIAALPFSSGKSPLWLYQLYSGTVNEYPYASVNAFNLFGLLGANYEDSSSTFLLFSYHVWGLIFIVAATLLSGWCYLRSRSAAFASLSALLLISGVFTFSSSMHERYLFPAAALALLAYAYFKDKRLLWMAFGYSATIFLNTYAVYFGYTSRDGHVGFLLFFSALLNIALCIMLVKVMLDRSRQHNDVPNLEAALLPERL
ncbi:dolichyl pyrophosphate Man9GlcNAc2 alpha-1,3-glucosyltransferase [Paenibacillus rhizophilus]|uniref:Dolichyl pyrophosphate Man9GlcNAc2 alpha-1,3-glucosyltransferase n=1 Tax=Paenibacillus rhizophilus TaxID=1850366 RepID=A0A3N9NZ85_9BACL|nr:dolichyl pyrophosphate Man9GlcNAc2 alpha-1,3-glucosyltransferase [Paenibacillus rhizophilus]RQW09228.1 dolichyl pyrophosphate Man9GlcNAc2 alpha-1,3-glucosyltransferase [Paenibacillus rhizophilus]